MSSSEEVCLIADAVRCDLLVEGLHLSRRVPASHRRATLRGRSHQNEPSWINGAMVDPMTMPTCACWAPTPRHLPEPGHQQDRAQQKWSHDVTVWEALPQSEQEKVIGHTKTGDAEPDPSPRGSHL